ncbi:hypothetical protein [Cloacibacillus evryensis]|uniref:hypothetical protein n=1 Tax=Cloacibacillus evryensis TaxID=508460 RepID=UPI00241DC2EA|nr:hypothetical protein [Cloacibacillus evryensis]
MNRLNVRILEAITAADDVLLDVLCGNCPARYLDRGATEGGVAIEPDEWTCPCDFEYGGAGCERRGDYERIKKMVGELAGELERMEGAASDEF